MPSISSSSESPAPETKTTMVSRYRWVICALLFFATTINYVDRQVLGIVAPGLQNGPVLFTPAMIADAPALARELQTPATPTARLLKSRLLPATITALGNSQPDVLRQTLSDDLNRIASGPLLYNAADFETAKFSAHLQQQIEKYQKAPPKGEEVTRFNHWIIEESLPAAFAPSMRWTDTQYGYINSAFSAAYAIGMLLVGALLDRFGVRWGYAIALLVWSLAAIGHAFAGSAFSFGVARFALGLGESANFPAAVQNRRRMVSQERTRAHNRHFQFRLQRRRHHRADCSADYYYRLRLAGGVRFHRLARIGVAVFLVADVSRAGSASQSFARRIGLPFRATRRIRRRRCRGCNCSVTARPGRFCWAA